MNKCGENGTPEDHSQKGGPRVPSAGDQHQEETLRMDETPVVILHLGLVLFYYLIQLPCFCKTQ